MGVRLIAAFAIVTAFAMLALAALPAEPASSALARVRLARGVAAGWRARAASLPLVRSWRPLDADTLRLAGLGAVTVGDVALAKLAGALSATLLAIALGLPPIAIPLIAYVAFVGPTVWIERRAAGRIATRRAAVLPLLDRVAALAGAGATVEQAIAQASEAAGALSPLLREAAARAALGLSLFEACAQLAERERVDELRDLARELARARVGGRPVASILRERREVLRLSWRASRLEAASRVDGALSLVLVLAYLPALLLLVVVPLFLGLLSALGT